MRTFTESAGGHLSGYVNMSGITGKENSGWIPDRRDIGQVMVKRLTGADACSLNHLQMQTSTLCTKFESRTILLTDSPDE